MYNSEQGSLEHSHSDI